ATNKLALLNKISCAIFGNVYNPQNIQRRLIGPTINSYYPNVKQIKLREITRMKTRLEDLAERKKRGQGRRSTLKKK
ncbi:hypothetical protein BCR41DRAFT_356836, partial [Lobosporangium transversale]